MALYHDATVSPTKAELVAAWVSQQSWCPPDPGAVEVIGAFRFDDPEGEVGIETMLASVDGTVVHVPLTYRADPVAGGDAGLITEMHHTALGQRWVYDGLHDDRYLTMLAAVAMTGQGEALGMVQYDGVWHLAPAAVRITGGGWTQERVSVDGFTSDERDGAVAVFVNERFELTVHRLPTTTPRTPLGLAATWDSQQEPVLLATVAER